MAATVNKEKLKEYISDEKTTWQEQAEFHNNNKEWLEKSALIAVKILSTLKSRSITQKELAESIGVSPQYINKVVKGNENLSLETICKIERSLGIVLISVQTFESTQIISTSYPFVQTLSRNASKKIIAQEIAYTTESKYKPEDKQLAA